MIANKQITHCFKKYGGKYWPVSFTSVHKVMKQILKAVPTLSGEGIMHYLEIPSYLLVWYNILVWIGITYGHDFCPKPALSSSLVERGPDTGSWSPN